MEINFSNAKKVIYGGNEATAVYVGNTKVWGIENYTPDLGYTTFTIGEAGELCIISLDKNPTTELYINNVVQELPMEGSIYIIGTKYPVNEGDIVKIKGGFSLRKNTLTINNIILQNNLTDCRYMFYGYSSLTEAPVIPNSVTNCYYMFADTSLTEAPVIPNGVTNCGGMFAYCSSLTEAPVIPNGVTNCSDMFNRCTNLTKAPEIPEGVTDCSGMFEYCTITKAPIIPNSVTNCSDMFSDCINLTEAPVIPNSVTDCSYMFSTCTNLTEAPVIPEGVTNCRCTFYGCSSLTEAPVIPNSVTDCSYMFTSCTNLTTLPQENIALFTNKPATMINTEECYNGCISLTNPPLSEIPSGWK